MVLQQQSKALNPKVESIRKLFEEKIQDTHEETMCKFGAILASGIIDAGGRNVNISLGSRRGQPNMIAIAGLTGMSFVFFKKICCDLMCFLKILTLLFFSTFFFFLF